MSRDAIKVPCTIYGFKRVNNSRYGNPRYRIDTDLGTYTTQSDAALGYEVSNIEHANRAALRSGEGFVAVLTTTRAGRVWDITTMILKLDGYYKACASYGSEYVPTSCYTTDSEV